MRRTRLGIRGLLVLALAVTALAASAARADTIDVEKVAGTLMDRPVQVVGHPDQSISGAQAAALSKRIGARDRGRIWIAIVPYLTQDTAGELAQDLSTDLGDDGVVIVVAGPNYHVTTSWGSGEAARVRLANAVNRPGDSLDVQMRRSIDSFAKADAAAGHPGAHPGQLTSSGQQSTPTSSAPASSAPASSAPASTGSSGSGGNGALIAVLIVAGLTIVVLGLVFGRTIRTSMHAGHRRKEEQADAVAQAQADFMALGEEIGALDIDSSMPNASAGGKDEYAKAIDCYSDAERRLRTPDDSYQFDRAKDAIGRGLGHVAAAKRLFNPEPAQPGQPASES